MPKYPTFPTLYDDVLKLDISKFKQWDYLREGQFLSSVITWSRNGNERGAITIILNTRSESPYVELDYKFRDDPRKYKVYFETTPSNLGKGEVWYFVCPSTGKRCRKLYSVSGYFCHREAFSGCMYESQTKSKSWRRIERIYGSYFDLDKHYKELYSKHFKRYYNGVPTKRFKKLISKIDHGDSFSTEEIERLYVFGI